MYRFIALLLISALLLTGCAKAETDSYIQVIVPEGGGYEAAVTPKPAAPSSASSPSLTPSEAAFTPQPTALPIQTVKPVPSLTAAPTAAPTVILTASDDDYNSGILELVNQYRQQAGLNTLKYSSKLQKAADIRAREIVTLFDHTRPNGASCSTAVTDDGISFSAFGENIFMCS